MGSGHGCPGNRSRRLNGALEARRWTGEVIFAFRQLKDACAAVKTMGRPVDIVLWGVTRREFGGAIRVALVGVADVVRGECVPNAREV